MVEINNENKVVKIELEQWCTVEQLVDMQTAIIDLISGYRYEDFGTGAGPMVSDALTLLTALLPNLEQQEQAFGKPKGFIKIPENMNIHQRKALIEAVGMIETGERDLTDNKVYEALTKKPFKN